MIFLTVYVIGFMIAFGTGYLVYIGIDTVALNGDGFKAFVKQGDNVKAGQKIVEVDLDKVKKAGILLLQCLLSLRNLQMTIE